MVAVPLRLRLYGAPVQVVLHFGAGHIAGVEHIKFSVLPVIDDLGRPEALESVVVGGRLKRADARRFGHVFPVDEVFAPPAIVKARPARVIGGGIHIVPAAVLAALLFAYIDDAGVGAFRFQLVAVEQAFVVFPFRIDHIVVRQRERALRLPFGKLLRAPRKRKRERQQPRRHGN